MFSWFCIISGDRGKDPHVQGAKPFRIGVPRFSFTGFDLGAGQSLAGTYHPLFLRDTFPANAKLSEVEGFLSTPMASTKACRFLQEIMLLPRYKCPPELAAKFARHLWRHFLPSFADAAKLDPQEANDLGSWAVRGSDVAMAAAVRHATKMPKRYSSLRHMAEAKAKALIVQALLTAIRNVKARTGANKFTNLDVAVRWPTRECAEALLEKHIEAHEASAIPVVSLSTSEAPLRLQDEEAHISSSSSSTSSTNCSDEPVQWLCAKGKGGKLHLCGLSEGKTLCGRSLRYPHSGTSLGDALKLDTSWSPRCYASLPSSAKDEWLKASTVE